MSRGERLYRKLLRALPEEYRREAETEMLEVFREAHADARGSGRFLSVPRFWAATAADVLVTAWKARERGPRRPLGGLASDVRVALRQMAGRPGFTFVVAASLGLAIGANTVVFSVFQSFLVKPIPVEDAERVVSAFALQGEDPFQVSSVDVQAWSQGVRSFEEVGAASARGFQLLVEGAPLRVEGAVVTESYLETLGVAPVLGRGFVDEDVRGVAAPVVLLGHGLWQAAFGGDPRVLGREVVLDGKSRTIVGVLPKGFDLPFSTELWIPLSFDELADDERFARLFFVAARLARGATFEEAQEEVSSVASRLESEYPRTHNGWTVRLLPLRRLLLDDIEGHLEPALLSLGIAVLFVLLIACGNVGSLLLARSVERSRELALRAALGAGRLRLGRQLAVESLVLAAAGGIAGAIVAAWTLPFVLRASPSRPLALGAHLHDAAVDGRALAFTLLLTLGTAVAVTFLPLWRLSGAKLSSALHEGGRSGPSFSQRRLLRIAAVVEVALAVALLASAGLLFRSYEKLASIPLGFEPEGLVMARLALPPGDDSEHDRRAALVESILERVQALAEVRSAGITTNVPLDHLSWDAAYAQEGGAPLDPDRLQLVADRAVTPGYLETLGVELVRGRLLDASDQKSSLPVVVVTEDLARRAWPGQDPIGKRIHRGRTVDEDSSGMTVVGVVAPTKEDRAAFRSERPAWYVPYAQRATSQPPILVVRGNDDPEALVPSLRAAITSVAPELPVYDVSPMDEHVSGILTQERFAALLATTFAGLGLALATLGVYGLLSYSVVSRRNEIGIRMALGESRASVVARIVADGGRISGIGIALGLGAAAFLGRLAKALLFQVETVDPVRFAAVGLLVLAVAVAASVIPARRASRVEPAGALRR